jgi:hypothetical protein
MADMAGDMEEATAAGAGNHRVIPGEVAVGLHLTPIRHPAHPAAPTEAAGTVADMEEATAVVMGVATAVVMGVATAAGTGPTAAQCAGKRLT